MMPHTLPLPSISPALCVDTFKFQLSWVALQIPPAVARTVLFFHGLSGLENACDAGQASAVRGGGAAGPQTGSHIGEQVGGSAVLA